MKRKKLRKLISCLLILAVFAMAGSADAAIVNGQWVIFTIANDELLPLNYNTMPYMYNSAMYVPYSVFTDYLGLRSVYNAKEEILILGNSERTLFYDMKNETTYDDREYGYSRKALVYNGFIYVPARFTAEFFGFTYSYDYEVPVVRLYDAAAASSDESVKARFEKEFESRLADYQNALPEKPDPETATPAPVYLMFAGDLNEHTYTILNTLAEYGVRAMFFLNAQTILENEDLVRRIYVDGHMIGVSSRGGLPESPEALTAAYDEANTALFQVLRCVSRTCYLPGGSLHETYDADYFRALADAGYRCWDFTIIAEDYLDYASAEELYDSLVESLITVELVQTLVLHSTQVSAETLPELLDYINSREGSILSADELTAPITF